MVAPQSLAVLFAELDGLPLPLAAHELAAAGVPVFPCVPGRKAPMLRRGFLAATSDLRRVDGWWRWQSSANIGVPTGQASGLVVVDVDVHGVDGYAAYARAARAGLFGEPLMTVGTPSGGQHSYFPADRDRMQRSWTVGKVGVDFRGDGGYVIAPPSALAMSDGRAVYRVEQVASGTPPPVDAVRLRDFLNPMPRHRPAPAGNRVAGRADADRLAAWLARQMKGDRNTKLFWAACRLAEGNVPLAQAVDALVKAEQADFEEREITRTVHSAYRSVGVSGSAGSGRARRASSGEPLSAGFVRRDIPRWASAVRGLE